MKTIIPGILFVFIVIAISSTLFFAIPTYEISLLIGIPIIVKLFETIWLLNEKETNNEIS